MTGQFGDRGSVAEVCPSRSALRRSSLGSYFEGPICGADDLDDFLHIGAVNGCPQRARSTSAPTDRDDRSVRLSPPISPQPWAASSRSSVRLSVRTSTSRRHCGRIRFRPTRTKAPVEGGGAHARAIERFCEWRIRTLDRDDRPIDSGRCTCRAMSRPANFQSGSIQIGAHARVRISRNVCRGQSSSSGSRNLWVSAIARLSCRK